MKTVQISDDVYDHLLQSTSFLGEDASSILRRLLKLPYSTATIPTRSQQSTHQVQPTIRSEITKFLESSRLEIERDAVQRFMLILSWLHQQHPGEFEGVVRIEGRKRLYFATDAETLAGSGVSVMPQQIPGTSYWVVTNNDTAKKKRMLEDVLRMLRYSPSEIKVIVASIG